MADAPIVIVGAGHAGVHAAARLVEHESPGGIVLIDEDDAEPYERPPLSKDLLKSGATPKFPRLRKSSYYGDNGIERMTGRSVVAIDRTARAVTLDDESTVSYHRLVLSTGSSPRTLPVPGGDLPGVVVLKTLKDSAFIRTKLVPGSRIVIIGAGYIGLEVAAAAVEAGSEVVLLEMQDRAMSRVTSRPVAEFFESLHAAHGVRFVFGASVVAVRESGNALEVVCADGNTHAADLVVVGIGVSPNQEVAEAAGLACSDGIIVDEHARTSDPSIYAAGDATRFTCPREGVSLRLECVQNAISQADAAANHIMGLPASEPEIPWFWTVQHGVRLQTAGVRNADDDIVIRGDPDAGRFSVLYLRDGRLAAIDTVRSLKDFVAGKKLIASRVPVDVRLSADPAVPLIEAQAAANAL